MHKIYLYVEKNNHIRKIAVDLPYLFTHKKIRLLKDYFENEMYLPILNSSNLIEKYFLTKEKIIKDDGHHYYFDLPFKINQAEKAEAITSQRINF